MKGENQLRSSIFKYLFIIVAVIIGIYSIYAIYFKDTKEETQDTSVSEEEPIQELKDIRLGISNFDTINPLITTNKEILNIDRLIFEPLINITEDYRMEMCLATECSKISDTIYVIKLDNNKKWHDGSSLMAKDIQFTIDRLKEGKSIYAYNVEKVTGVEIIDASTIKIILSESVPFFEYNLTFPILPNNYYMGENFYETNKTPIGTGMYKISSIDLSNIVLEKNMKWWNIKEQEPKIEKINIKIFSEMGEIYNTFKLGNIDIFTTSKNDIQNYIGTIGYETYEFKGRNFDYLAFNCQDSILKDVEVRKMIAYAIDKTNIISTIYSNSYYSSEFPLDYGNYLYENKSSIQYNIDDGKRILLENGWDFKNSRWQKTQDYRTRKITLKLTVNKDDANRVLVAENIKTQLAKIGVPVTISKVSTAQYNKTLQNKSYQMILTGVYNSYSPNLETFLGDNNLQNYNNDELNNILSEVKNTTDQNILKEKYDRIIEIYNEELPFLSLYRNKSVVVKNQKLTGEIAPNNYFSYYRIFTWSRT